MAPLTEEERQERKAEWARAVAAEEQPAKLAEEGSQIVARRVVSIALAYGNRRRRRQRTRTRSAASDVHLYFNIDRRIR